MNHAKPGIDAIEISSNIESYQASKDHPSYLTLSIVIPVFNEEENLEELIERCLTVCDRIGRPYEIILVDDGSRDRSREIIQEAAGQNAGN